MIGDADLAQRLEAFQADVTAGSAIDVLRIGEGTAVFGGVGSPVTQAINIDRDVDRVERFFFDHGADSVVQASPWSPPEFLNELVSRAYKFHEFENVFARDLVAFTPAPVANIEIEQTRDVDKWARIAAEPFANEQMSVDFLVDVMKPFGRAKHARCYLAYVDGEPAGAATMFVSGERRIVGLFGAGTLERFRRRGIQNALLQRRLSDAKNEGCEIAIVTTLPGSDSHRNVARRAFELMYTKISMRKTLALTSS